MTARIPSELQAGLGKHIAACGTHIARHIDYARDSVYNNHLLSEALGLYVAGRMLPGLETACAWVSEGRRLLEREARPSGLSRRRLHPAVAQLPPLRDADLLVGSGASRSCTPTRFRRIGFAPLSDRWTSCSRIRTRRTAGCRIMARTTAPARCRFPAAISPISGRPCRRPAS